jgi:hypothetical protein
MEKKFALCATKTINILTRVVRKNVFNQKKTHSPLPLQVKWSVPNQIQIDELHAEDIFMIILLSARMKLSVSPLVHSLKMYDSFLSNANMLTLMLHETILII